MDLLYNKKIIKYIDKKYTKIYLLATLKKKHFFVTKKNLNNFIAAVNHRKYNNENS